MDVLQQPRGMFLSTCLHISYPSMLLLCAHRFTYHAFYWESTDQDIKIAFMQYKLQSIPDYYKQVKQLFCSRHMALAQLAARTMATAWPGRGATCGCVAAHAACSPRARLYSCSRAATSWTDLLLATAALSSAEIASLCMQNRHIYVKY